jgi:hypothetical protein
LIRGEWRWPAHSTLALILWGVSQNQTHVNLPIALYIIGLHGQSKDKAAEVWALDLEDLMMLLD